MWITLLHQDRPPISPLRYAWKQSNRAFDIAFVATLLIWGAQELWLRDQLLPVEDHRKVHHLLDMLSVVWGSFFTGYIFYWLINHIPESKKAYGAQLDLESQLLHIFNSYRSLIVALMMEGTRTNSEDELGSIYRLPFGTEDWPDFFPALLQKGPPIDEDFPIGEHGEYSDRCGSLIASSYHFISDVTQDVLDLKVKLDHELVDALEQVAESSQYIEDSEGDEDLRMLALANLCDSLAPLYEYVERRVKDGDYIDSRMPKLFQKNTFRDLWEEAGIEKQKEVNFDLRWSKKVAPPAAEQPDVAPSTRVPSDLRPSRPRSDATE